jgi:hypothetical protein
MKSSKQRIQTPHHHYRKVTTYSVAPAESLINCYDRIYLKQHFLEISNRKGPRWPQPCDHRLSRFTQTLQQQQCNNKRVNAVLPRPTMQMDRMEISSSPLLNLPPKIANHRPHSRQSPRYHLRYQTFLPTPLRRDHGLLSALQVQCALYKCPVHLLSRAQEIVYDSTGGDWNRLPAQNDTGQELPAV